MAALRDGAPRRSFLTGLWLAAMSSLIEAGEPADVAALLHDRTCAIRGQGRNADAPVLVEDEPARARRCAEAERAAAAIVAALVDLPVAGEDDFPELFLDVAVAMLVEAWGPAHVRRALWDQRAALEDGSVVVVLPAEPAASNGAPRAKADPVPSVPETRADPPAVPAPPRPAGRADIHADAVVVDGGRVAYAVAARIEDGDRRELREVCGMERGLSLRACVMRVVAGIAAGLPGHALRASTPVEGVLRALDGTGGEQGLDEAIAAIRPIEWTLRETGAAGDLGRRCDRLIRDRVDEAAADAA